MDEIETLEPDELHGGRGRISRRTDGPVELVVKTATGGDRAALRREAEVLRAVGGAEVVQVVDLHDGLEQTELVLRDTGGPSLGAALADEGTSSATALQLLASACDTVARLHGRGWAHGRITTDHVLLTRRGRMRLCSLRAATPVESDPDAARADRAALLRMVDDWTRAPAGPGRDPRLGARLRAEVLARRTHRLPDDPDPRVLARILRRTGRASGPPMRTMVWALPIIVSIPLVLLVAGSLRSAVDEPRATAAPTTTATTVRPSTSTTATASSSAAPTTSVAAATTVATPVTTSAPSTAPAALTTDGNTVTVDGRRYRVGEDGDIVAVSDWDCDGIATPAVLRPSTGTVHVFDGWATPGATATATEVGRVDGAVSIASPDGPCGPPVVTTADGAARVVSIPGARP
ncbi:hypothetical protein [Dermatobacter hominis]|uniref:hypothetical protein n=1 Tax=Dermatobacter hominis TaxID=2884263 RepID=UPI001D11CCF2|nr:hypothetical protein [Dermatobacter hominis]UDY35789.1 hypothetical protein LH044_21000 [Dermatobacter hominis]